MKNKYIYSFLLYISMLILAAFLIEFVFELLLFSPFYSLREYHSIFWFIFFIMITAGFREIRIYVIKHFDFTVLLNFRVYLTMLSMLLLLVLAHYIFIYLQEVAETMTYRKYLYHFSWNDLLTKIIFTPLWEEILFRGILFGYLFNKTGRFWFPAVLASIIFGCFHLDYFIPSFIFSIFSIYLFKHFNSLIPGIFLHALWNFLMLYSLI
ncbi:CPBP family intramembrane glutamic endopeptidase [Jeotgalibacillus terrae]|uniref:CPBP family intramembrane glutamic endopeptidase n=1 Tax=Jeotgalibacillus terrae TaxID=587735 RepID=A0ABW5ZKE1_9BACL|nr:type II CAAX endopeptidase family protein [Jeotgalibacillus terrae]MBM7578147.1 membrane protease YdiL (CAAX protease family) [Jeotgalibacillus terrae]